MTGDAPNDDGSGPALHMNAPFRRLWLARSISAFGDSLGLVVLIVFVADTAGETLAVAALLEAVRAVAGQVLQPVASADIPDLVRDRHLVFANSAIGFARTAWRPPGHLWPRCCSMSSMSATC